VRAATGDTPKIEVTKVLTGPAPTGMTCRVLGFSKQGFYKWRAQPITARDWDDTHLINAALDIHHDDPEYGYRYIADELAAIAAVTRSVTKTLRDRAVSVVTIGTSRPWRA
jgi:hypothetical protein